MTHISQREARQTKKRLQELEAQQRTQLNAWASDYPGGVHIATEEVTDETMHKVDTARKLGHVVVVIQDGNEQRFYAVRP